jgi:hypothetical protein
MTKKDKWISVKGPWAMEWLVGNNNALAVISNILIINSIKRLKIEDWQRDINKSVAFGENDIIFYLKDIKIGLNIGQIKRAIKNLIRYEFIEVDYLKSLGNDRFSMRITVLHNPFDPDLHQAISKEYCGGGSRLFY